MKWAVWTAVFVTLVAPAAMAQEFPPLEVNEFDINGVEKIQIKTDLVSYQFSADDAVLESIYIHFNTFDTQPTELLPGVNTDAETFRALVANGVVSPFRLDFDERDDGVYAYTITHLEQGRVELTFTRLSGELQITKKFTIENDPYYRVRFALSLINTGSTTLTFDQGYTMMFTAGLAEIDDPDEVYLSDNERTTSVPIPPDNFGGVGFQGQGLSLFLKNETPTFGDTNTTLLPSFGLNNFGQKMLGSRVESLTLAAGASANYDFLMYGGRLKYVLMDESGLGVVAGKGPFSQFLVPMIQGLEWLYRWTGNYGWAIIIFTLLTRIIMYPLLRKQFQSMAKMRELQPKLNRLKERYPTFNELRKLDKDGDMAELQAKAKDNREKMQKKMMEIYQKQGVNPLGGCLPSLIQMPFLILLWRTILYSAESVHFSPGFLWMTDMSQPDPFYILVVITAGFMVMQTKMTPQMSTGGQNQIMMWMFPLMMVVFLKDFPAGLWLYYFLTTAIQVLQQMFINREIAANTPPEDEVDDVVVEDDEPEPPAPPKAKEVKKESDDSAEATEEDKSYDTEDEPSEESLDEEDEVDKK
jgi:YidC/Oxa1 family membrane protein insertase